MGLYYCWHVVLTHSRDTMHSSSYFGSPRGADCPVGVTLWPAAPHPNPNQSLARADDVSPLCTTSATQGTRAFDAPSPVCGLYCWHLGSCRTLACGVPYGSWCAVRGNSVPVGMVTQL